MIRHPFTQIASLFDLPRGRQLADEGIARASDAAGRQELLALAQAIARDLSADGGEVTSDDVAAELARRGHDWATLGNAAGAVFRGPFRWTGLMVPSRRPSAHGRMLRVWTHI